MKIVETKNFVVESHPSPEVSRHDGGHLRINSKRKVDSRLDLTADEVIELALLTNVVGRAMKDALKRQGIILGRINYQENGNWNPVFHVHLYGRAVDATYHPFGEPLKTARKLEDKVVQEQLSDDDCQLIRELALEYAHEEGYQNLSLS